MASEYSAESIKVLEGLEGVKKRPAMYIGSTGKDGLHHLVYEVVDNSVDEALAGFCKKIDVSINKDGSVTVEDDGRGIPVDIHKEYKLPAVQIALTKLHAGGKFDKKSYVISGGLHGVGVSVVNALSKKMIVEIKRDGKIYRQEYSRGDAKTKIEVIGKTDNGQTGTKVTFWPDPDIFSVLEFDYKVLETRFREIVFLNAGLKINLFDEKKDKKEEFFAAGGLIEFVKWINRSKEALHKPIYFKRESKDNVLEVAVQYNTGYQENIFGFVNTINTVEGGTHVSGFKTALTRVINDYLKKTGNGKEIDLTGDDTREGLTAIISLKMAEPQFEGQTKTKLGNSDIKGIVDSISSSALSEFFEENPPIAKKIALKVMESAKARVAAKKAKDLVRRKSAFSLGGLPGKLADCSKKKTEDTELYLVEGESAGGSAKQARSKEIQAILPLKGKILNIEKANPSKALSSEEIANMITVIGTGVGEQFDINKLRYGKIIIMSVDGRETTFIQTPQGEIRCVKIGEFIDFAIENKLNVSNYKVLCFNLKTMRSQFKSIKAVIKHPIDETLYEIKTSYGRSVKVTSSHSVFVYENNEVRLKKGNEIKKGDKIVAPKNLPLYNYNYPKKIDLLSLLVRNKKNITVSVYIRGNSISELLKHKLLEKYKDDDNLVGERVIIPEEVRKKIRSHREENKLSQQFICENVGIKQPCTYYDWERGKNKPTLKKFEEYIKTLGMDKGQVLSQVQIVKSHLDNVWERQYKNSGRNKVKNYISLAEIEESDLSYIGEDIIICAEHYAHQGLGRYIQVNKSFMKLMGFWLAEGSWSLRNGLRMAIGNNDTCLAPELNMAFKEVFGLPAKLSYAKNHQTCGELKLVNKIVALFWKFIFNLEKSTSINKKMPSIAFNVSRDLQLEFLRTYFLGDGTLSKHNLSFTTVSRDLADQLMYLLQSFGVMASISEREPSINSSIISKHRVYTVSVNSKNNLLILKRIWENHRNAHLLQAKIEGVHFSINQKFVAISEDLVGLEVKDIQEVECSSSDVYDFSVDEDENFVAGFGGLCCHNTDADVDGEHIKTLLLTFFFRFMPHLIEGGNIYVAMPPLYRVRKNKDHYVYSDKELKKLSEKLGKALVTRFKGLGEMSLDQLWETTMNPKTRKIKKIYIEDAIEADRVFSMLMGDDVQARKEFIQDNAQTANLDV